jgi:hypothetical protein
MTSPFAYCEPARPHLAQSDSLRQSAPWKAQR